MTAGVIGAFVALTIVAVVQYVRVRDRRLVPVMAIPVSLIGTFVVMKAMGMSINNLTLFGLVLAIGIVVDDAKKAAEAILGINRSAV